MKAIVVAPGLTGNLPYLALYKNLFEQNNVHFSILQWDRLAETVQKDKDIYKHGYAFSPSKIKRLLSYYQYLKWIRKRIREEEPDIIVVATIAPAVCLLPFLYKWRKRYILDIRDYSPLVKYCSTLVSKAIKWSRFTLISSKGFLRWLPSGTYLPVYNFSEVPNYEKVAEKRSKTSVATIGFLRDYKENILVIDSLGGKEDIELTFHGTGIVADRLMSYVQAKEYKNIYFTGAYKKEEEPAFYLDADIINIIMPFGITGSTLLSNRFVNAVVYKRPMIVSKGSYQEELVKKYGLGLSVDAKSDIYPEIIEFLGNFDASKLGERYEELKIEMKQEHDDSVARIDAYIKEIKFAKDENS